MMRAALRARARATPLPARWCASAAAVQGEGAVGATAGESARVSTLTVVSVSTPTPVTRTDVRQWLSEFEPPLHVPADRVHGCFDGLLRRTRWYVDMADVDSARAAAATSQRKGRKPNRVGDKARRGGPQREPPACSPVALGVFFPHVNLLPASALEKSNRELAAVKETLPNPQCSWRQVVYLHHLQAVDRNYNMKDRLQLLHSWLQSNEFDAMLTPVKGKMKANSANWVPTGRYLATMQSEAEAQRLVRELHGDELEIRLKPRRKDDREKTAISDREMTTIKVMAELMDQEF